MALQLHHKKVERGEHSMHEMYEGTGMACEVLMQVSVLPLHCIQFNYTVRSI